jgi:hypothetical protein
MSPLALKRSLKILAVTLVATAAMSGRQARAVYCPGDPFFFCDCARMVMQNCNAEYQACDASGENEGCTETYFQCRLDSGIDQCE